MSNVGELLWLLRGKGFTDASPLTEGCGVAFSLPGGADWGWQDLIRRFRLVYGPWWALTVCNGRAKLTIGGDGVDLDRTLSLLINAVSLDEYAASPVPPNNTTFDLKLGISCNNNCLHCVIKPNILGLKKQNPDAITLSSGVGMQCSMDLTYDEIIRILAGREAGTIVLTGGEPTLNPAFIPVVKWLYYNRPDVRISLQTNGRLLANEELVRALRRYTRTIGFAIAVHGLEETHNHIVFNRKETGNPYQETIAGIHNVLRYFPKDAVRSEIVATRFNLHELVEAVRVQHEEVGLTRIGISYPHLEGFSSGAIGKLAPTMVEMVPVLSELNRYLQEHRDLDIVIEELPLCIYNQLGASEILLNSFPMRNKKQITLNFMGTPNDQYCKCWVEQHRKLLPCLSCVVGEECIGIWRESSDINEGSLQPIRSISPALHGFMRRNW